MSGENMLTYKTESFDSELCEKYSWYSCVWMITLGKFIMHYFPCDVNFLLICDHIDNLLFFKENHKGLRSHLKFTERIPPHQW